MKHAKKLASLLLALVMVLSLSVAAFALENNPPAETGNTITVENAQAGETYSIYKMLDLDVNEDQTAFSYKVNRAWETFFHTGAGKDYVSIDAQGYVTWKDGMGTAEKMETFGKAAAAYAADVANSVPKAKEDQTPAADGDITFTQLDPGYYLITSTNGTKVIVDTTPTAPNPSIREKNENPTIDKTVEEDSTGVYGATNDADIGQTVNFKTIVNAKSGAKNYVVHDKMSNGLTYTPDSVKVYLNPTIDAKGAVAEDAVEVIASGNFEVKTSALGDACDFHVVFSQTFCDKLTDTDKIVITYSATLNENAVVATAETNDTKLSWGDKNETEWVETETYTWEADVFKYAQDGEKEKALSGAKFTLSKNENGVNPIVLISEGNNVYRVAKTGESGTVTEITTDATGKFTIRGLDADTYYLTETTAPTGYNTLAESVTITIGENGVVNATAEATQGVDEVKVLNQSGTELPSTGGIGTTIFYVIGSILLVGAAVLLITKKRVNAAQ